MSDRLLLKYRGNTVAKRCAQRAPSLPNAIQAIETIGKTTQTAMASASHLPNPARFFNFSDTKPSFLISAVLFNKRLPILCPLGLISKAAYFDANCYHVGAHCEDQDALHASLVKNKAPLVQNQVALPHPRKYRNVIRENL
jgi:hypothetical protein